MKRARGVPKVYFIRPAGQRGPIKIGCSICPEQRIMEFARQSPVLLELIATTLGDSTTEAKLHSLFRSYHSHLEWFHASDAIYDLIDAIRAGANIDDILQDVQPRRLARAVENKGVVNEKKRYMLRLAYAQKKSRHSLPETPALSAWKKIDWRDRVGVPLPENVKQEIDQLLRVPTI